MGPVKRLHSTKSGSSHKVLISSPEKVKKVRFADNVDVVLFDRTVSLDRFPDDGNGYPLGMRKKHFHREVQPLAMERTERKRLREFRVRLCARRQMLTPYVERLSQSAHDTLVRLKEEMKAIRTSRREVGCSCEVACYPDTCECLLSGIDCCRVIDMPVFRCECTPKRCGVPFKKKKKKNRRRRREGRVSKERGGDKNGQHKTPK